MGWANFAIEALAKGEQVKIKPHGNSMRGKIESGDTVVLIPSPQQILGVGDIVLVRVKGNVYLHLIKAIDGERFQIGNNIGRINGWVSRSAIYGIAIEVDGKRMRRENEVVDVSEPSDSSKLDS
jgi:SOS-response transcriptional repressor LexA